MSDDTPAPENEGTEPQPAPASPASRPPAPGSQAEELAAFLGKDVVLDTRGELLYVGRLEHVGDWFLTLVDADVHDLSDSRTRKDVYLIEAARFGVKKNRHQVMVRSREVVSLSTLASVILY
tara:strand:+ start:425 stop:790 length:366 start_codon:yes stop_codon:yes gene_type:complete